MVYNQKLCDSHINYFDISECSTLRRTQRTTLCLKQLDISRVIPKTVSAKCSKNEEIRGTPRESLILEYLEMIEIPTNDAGDYSHVWINMLFKFLHYLHQA